MLHSMLSPLHKVNNDPPTSKKSHRSEVLIREFEFFFNIDSYIYELNRVIKGIKIHNLQTIVFE